MNDILTGKPQKIISYETKQMNSHDTENNESSAESIQALRQEIKELKLKVSNVRRRQKRNHNDSTCFNCGQSWPRDGNPCPSILRQIQSF